MLWRLETRSYGSHNGCTLHHDDITSFALCNSRRVNAEDECLEEISQYNIGYSGCCVWCDYDLWGFSQGTLILFFFCLVNAMNDLERFYTMNVSFLKFCLEKLFLGSGI